jgi:hypothetical protein
MKVFISWSKSESCAVAAVFRDWLPKVIQQCREPYMSTETTKGDTWFASITEALATAKVGVVFITSENQHETWLNFESGALLTKLDKQRLCPVLVGLKKADYNGPLKSLQLTEFEDKEDMRKLLRDINTECEDPLDQQFLDDDFDLRWADLQTQAHNALAPSRASKPAVPKVKVRTIDDKIDELLELMRETRSSNSELSAYTRVLIGKERDRTDRFDERSPFRMRERGRPLTAERLLNERLDSEHREDESIVSDAARIRKLGGEHVLIDGKYVGDALRVSGTSEDGQVMYRTFETGKVSVARLRDVTFSDVPF